jgi:hypothetical protein
MTQMSDLTFGGPLQQIPENSDLSVISECWVRNSQPA